MEQGQSDHGLGSGRVGVSSRHGPTVHYPRLNCESSRGVLHLGEWRKNHEFGRGVLNVPRLTQDHFHTLLEQNERVSMRFLLKVSRNVLFPIKPLGGFSVVYLIYSYYRARKRYMGTDFGFREILIFFSRLFADFLKNYH